MTRYSGQDIKEFTFLLRPIYLRPMLSMIPCLLSCNVCPIDYISMQNLENSATWQLVVGDRTQKDTAKTAKAAVKVPKSREISCQATRVNSWSRRHWIFFYNVSLQYFVTCLALSSWTPRSVVCSLRPSISCWKNRSNGLPRKCSWR